MCLSEKQCKGGTKYEGRSIYKVLFAAVFLIFQNKRIQDIRFVGNLILNIFGKFHNHDINNMKSETFRASQWC
jgi:hypothetical protein